MATGIQKKVPQQKKECSILFKCSLMYIYMDGETDSGIDINFACEITDKHK